MFNLGAARSLHQTLLFAHHRCVDAAVPSLAETRNAGDSHHPGDAHWTREPAGAVRALHAVFGYAGLTRKT